MRGASGGLVFCMVFALGIVAAGSPPAAAGTPAPSPPPSAAAAPAGALPDDAAATVRARDWLGRLQRGDVDRSQLTDDLSRGLGDDAVASLAQLLGPLGTPKRFVLERHTVGDATADWVFRVSWPSASYAYTFGIDRATGKIAELYVAPGAPAT